MNRLIKTFVLLLFVVGFTTEGLAQKTNTNKGVADSYVAPQIVMSNLTPATQEQQVQKVLATRAKTTDVEVLAELDAQLKTLGYEAKEKECADKPEFVEHWTMKRSTHNTVQTGKTKKN